MATRLARIARNKCSTQSTLCNLWQRHSITDPIVRNQQKLKQQYKDYCRPPQSSYRNTKSEAGLPLVSAPVKRSSEIGLVSWYLGIVKSRPVVTKSITCALIYTAADLTSQAMSRSSGEPFDTVRTVRMAGLGMLLIGPSLHYWFNFVAKLFPKRDFLSTFKKMALAQVSYGPCMTTLFFAANAALQGETGAEIVARLKRDTVPAIVGGAVFWCLSDFVTLKFAPLHLQPLASNSFAYLWSVYATYMASLEKVGEA